ncbi:MAG TPA: formate dehydrogenase subunit delta, partial [Caulobacteraceae bacterium]|nr:formate dehydrogenase subunit delta [Caulobacteraceae bacterium]
MEIQRLVYMANQIAVAFRTAGEAAAVAATEDHLRKFWDPRMRRQIVEHLARGGEGLDAVARAAVARLDAAAAM